LKPAIVDCSAVLCWCFADEATNASERLLARVERHGAFVPLIWRIEVANVLLMADRRGRLPAGVMAERLGWLAALPIQEDTAGSDHLWKWVVDLAAGERLTVYDASYLELALRLALPLATKDRDLVAAARRRGADLIPLMDA